MSIENTPGLDVETALKRLGGNTKLYARLLDQFQNSYAGAGDEMAALLAASDMTTAERVAHTIKGLAGNLGAVKLQESAAALERLCRENAGQPAIDAAFTAYKTDLGAAIDAVRAYLASQAQSAPAPAPTPATPLLPRLEALLALLRDDDARSDDEFRRMKGELESLDSMLAQTLGTAIAGFDFSTALVVAEALRDKLRPGG